MAEISSVCGYHFVRYLVPRSEKTENNVLLFLQAFSEFVEKMAFMYIYLLPVIFAIVFIPQSSESTTIIETDETKTTIAEVTGIIKEGLVQKSSPENVNNKHKHRHRKMMETDVESSTDEVSRISDKINSGQKILPEKAKSSADENTDTSGEVVTDMLENVGQDTSTEHDNTQDIDTPRSENEEFDIDNGKYVKEEDDDDDGNSNDGKADDMYSGSKLRTDETASQFHEMEKKPCLKCTNKPVSEKEIKIEVVKQHLLQKLGLSSAPKVDGPLPPLPFDFYVGEDFSMNDEEDREEEERRQAVRTREIFVYGKDSK